MSGALWMTPDQAVDLRVVMAEAQKAKDEGDMDAVRFWFGRYQEIAATFELVPPPAPPRWRSGRSRVAAYLRHVANRLDEVYG